MAGVSWVLVQIRVSFCVDFLWKVCLSPNDPYIPRCKGFPSRCSSAPRFKAVGRPEGSSHLGRWSRGRIVASTEPACRRFAFADCPLRGFLASIGPAANARIFRRSLIGSENLLFAGAGGFPGSSVTFSDMSRLGNRPEGDAPSRRDRIRRVCWAFVFE